jgi:integrase
MSSEKRKLTVSMIEGLKGTGDRYLVADSIGPNLFLQIGKSGAVRTWIWRGRLDGKVSLVTLGRYPVLSLAAARDRARDIAKARASGVNPIAQEATAVAEAAKLAERTLTWLFERYMEAEGEAQRSGKEKRRMYERDIKPLLGSRSIFDIEHDDLSKIVSDKAVTSPIQSNALVRLLSRLFRWAVRDARTMTGLKINPMADVVTLSKPASRDRYLDSRELRYLMIALAESATDFAPVARLIIHTAVRKNEALEARWDEFDMAAGEWLIPGSRTKNGRAMLVPLLPPVLAILNGLKKHETSPLLFWARGNPEKPYSGITRGLLQLEKLMVKAGKADGWEKPIPRWTLHDLRRSVSTGMNGMRDAEHRGLIDSEVVEAVLNHVSGTKGGVAGTYNHHSYFFEKRRALSLWSDYLAGLIKPD